MACLPEGQSSHKHLGEDKTSCHVQHAGRRDDHRTQLGSAPGSLGVLLQSLPSNKSNFQRSCRQSNPLRMAVPAEGHRGLWLACGHEARRCSLTAPPTSPATGTQEQRLRRVPASLPTLKLLGRGSFCSSPAPLGSATYCTQVRGLRLFHQSSTELPEWQVCFCCGLKQLWHKSSWVAGVLIRRPALAGRPAFARGFLGWA